MSKSFYHKVTNEQWEIIETQLPKAKRTGRPGLNPRNLYWSQEQNGDIFPKNTGIGTAFRWIKQGVFEKILQALIENDRKYYVLQSSSKRYRSIEKIWEPSNRSKSWW